MTDLSAPEVPTALIPTNEPERLAALYRYDILDTSAEVAFDRVTSLAARLFQIPTVLISLVDESRAWFKSSIGFDASEVPRDATICSFAVLTDEPLIVPDTQLDERFACNPFVLCEPGLRFYAGAPLITHDGFNLGTLCLLDTVPHDPLTAEQQATLVDLAAIVIDELELRLSARQIARVDAALLEITRGLSTVTGGEFIDSLVQHLAKVLDTDYAYIGLIEGDDPKMMRTIATCAGGEIVNNLEYLLEDTPCWEVIKQRKICCYQRNVQSYFPNAPLLKPLVVESYAAIPFYDDRGEVLGVLGVMDGKPLQDVHLAESLLRVFSDRVATEIDRQQAQQALAASEERTKLAIDAAQLGTFEWDIPTQLVTWNRFHRTLLGYTPEVSSSFAAWERRVHPDDLAKVTAALQLAQDTDRDYSCEYRVIWEDDSLHWIIALGRFYYDSDNRPLKIAGIIQDITDRKRTEEMLRSSEERLRMGLEAARMGTWDWNILENQIVWSSNMEALFGLAPGEFDGSYEQFVERLHPEDRDRVLEAINAAMSPGGNYDIEFRVVYPDGTIRWALSQGKVFHDASGQPVRMTGVDLNISDRKQKELNNNFLAEIQKDLAFIKDISQMLDVVGEKIRAWFGFWMLAFGDVDLATNTCTPFHTTSEKGTLTQVSHYSLSDFFSENHLQQLHAGETVAINDVYEDPGIKDQGSAYEAYPVRSLLALSYIVDEEWKFLMAGSRREACIWRKDEIDLMSELMLRIYLEIERSRSESALEKLNQRFESAMDAVDGIIFEWNIDTDFVYRSQGLFNLIGVEVEDAPPTWEWWFNLVHPEDRIDTKSFFAQVEANNDRYQGEYRVHHADGHWIDVWERAYVRRNEAGEIVNMIGFTSDISDRKRLEKKLEERNQELNLFSHTVSHDLKAPLRGISNLAGWISQDLSETVDPDILANLELMRSRVSRMDRLIDGLLYYAKVGNTEASLETFSVEQLLVEIVDSLSISDSFVVELPAELPSITTHRVLLNQVLANLIGNAYKHHDRSEGRIQITVQPEGEIWRFSVIDDGPGIAPENQERVFDIFKTLSGNDKNNTGIGLSIVKKLVETHGGTITLESQIGMGTTFNFSWIAD